MNQNNQNYGENNNSYNYLNSNFTIVESESKNTNYGDHIENEFNNLNAKNKVDTNNSYFNNYNINNNYCFLNKNPLIYIF